MLKETLKKLFAEMKGNETRLIFDGTEFLSASDTKKYYSIVYKGYLDNNNEIAILKIATFNISDYQYENYRSPYFNMYGNNFKETYYLINDEIYFDDMKVRYTSEDFKNISSMIKEKNKMLIDSWNNLKNSYTKEKLIEFWNSQERYEKTILCGFVNDETILYEVDKRLKNNFNKLNENIETTEKISCELLRNFNLVDYILLTDIELKERYLNENEKDLIYHSSDIQSLYYKLFIDEKEKEKEIKENYLKENQERFNFIEKLSTCFKLINDNNYKSVKITLKDDSIIQLKETQFHSLNNIIGYEEISNYNFKVIQNNGLKTYGYNYRVADVSIYDIKKIEYSKKVLFEN